MTSGLEAARSFLRRIHGITASIHFNEFRIRRAIAREKLDLRPERRRFTKDPVSISTGQAVAHIHPAAQVSNPA